MPLSGRVLHARYILGVDSPPPPSCARRPTRRKSTFAASCSIPLSTACRCASASQNSFWSKALRAAWKSASPGSSLGTEPLELHVVYSHQNVSLEDADRLRF